MGLSNNGMEKLNAISTSIPSKTNKTKYVKKEHLISLLIGGDFGPP